MHTFIIKIYLNTGVIIVNSLVLRKAFSSKATISNFLIVLNLNYTYLKINLLKFFSIEIQRIGEKEYLNSITELQLNDDYVAVLMGNQLQLHSVIILIQDLVQTLLLIFLYLKLAESAIEGRESILFPVADQNEGKITSFALTKEYLIMGTDVIIFYLNILDKNFFMFNDYYIKTGQLCHFNIDDWLFVNKYKHNMAIKKVFPEFYGMSVAFIDHNGEGFIYNPISSSVVKIQNFPSTTKGIIWETFELNKVSIKQFSYNSMLNQNIC